MSHPSYSKMIQEAIDSVDGGKGVQVTRSNIYEYVLNNFNGLASGKRFENAMIGALDKGIESGLWVYGDKRYKGDNTRYKLNKKEKKKEVKKVKSKTIKKEDKETKARKTQIKKKKTPKGPPSGFYMLIKEKWVDPLPNPSKIVTMTSRLTKKQYTKYKELHIEWFTGPKVEKRSIVLTKKWIKLDLGQETNNKIRKIAMTKRWPTKIKGELWHNGQIIMKITVLNPFPRELRKSGSGFDGDAGHLIAKSLGGTIGSDNIIPQNPLVNEQQGFGWRDFETTTLAIVKESKQGQKFEYNVKPVYGSLKDYTKLWML